MITDLRLAELAAATYTSDPTWTGTGPDQSIHACRTDEPGGLIVISFRGSVSEHDWFLDFAAIPRTVTFDHAVLGALHFGFWMAAASVLPQIALAVHGKDYALDGHSLGGAIALDVGAALAADGHPPVKIVTLGAPKVGYAPYRKALAAVPIAQYRRGNDPVPDVPLSLPGFPFVHARLPLIQIGVPQDDPFACHHIAGYVDDVTAVFQKAA